jgi:hypothetical protein
MRRRVRGRPEAAVDRRWAVVGGGRCSVSHGWQKEAAWPEAATGEVTEISPDPRARRRGR